MGGTARGAPVARMAASPGVSAVRGLDGKAALGVLKADDLGLYQLGAQTLCLRAAAREQLRARKRFREAEVVFNLIGFAERAAVLV